MSNDFDKRLANTPEDWKEALVNVLDTAESVVISLRSGEFGLANPAVESPLLVSELTRLVIDTHALRTSGAADG